jgi:hypothetical protein
MWSTEIHGEERSMAPAARRFRYRVIALGIVISAFALALGGPASTTLAQATDKKSCADAKKIKIEKCSTVVLLDTMPGDDLNGGGRGTSTPVDGVLEDNDLAVAFEVGLGQDVLLHSIDLPLMTLYGVNQADVYLVGEKARATEHGGEFYAPDDSVVLEHWYLENVPSSYIIFKLESSLHPKLLAGERYWVYLGAHVPIAYIGWPIGSSNYTGGSWLAERNSVYPDWITLYSSSGPGHAVRVTALQ